MGNHNIDVLIVCNDIGGANAIYPVFQSIKDKVKVKLVCTGDAIKVFNSFKKYFVEDHKFNSVNLILKELTPSILFTGTSEYSNQERLFWYESKRLNIKTIAIIDSWTNIKERFIYFPVENNGEKLVQPDIIIIPDDNLREQIDNEGWCVSDLKVCGQPHLEKSSSFFEKKRNIKKVENSSLMFISEPVIEKRNIRPIGYDQFSVASQLVNQLLGGIVTKIIIKPHPKENIDNWQKWKNSWPKEIKKNLVISDLTIKELILNSEFIVGMASMALIEAAMSGSISIAIQPHRKYIPNIFVDNCDQIKLLIQTDNLSKNFEEIKDKFISSSSIQKSLFFSSTKRTSELILKYI